MCICINCNWVDRCKTYYAIEKQHGVDHLSANPDFQGKNPSIHISLKEMPEGETSIEWDVRSCGSFKEDNGKWSRLRPGEKIPS